MSTDGHSQDAEGVKGPRTEVHPLTLVALFGGLLALTTMIVLLALVLSELKTSREHIEAQDAKVTELLRRSRPLLDSARPLVNDVAALVEPLASVRGDLRSAGEQLPEISFSVEQLARGAAPVVSELAAADLSGALAAGRDLAAQLTADDRAALLIDRTLALLDEVDRRGLLPRSVKAVARLKGVLKIQRLTLEVQRRNLRLQRHGVKIQRESLRHVRSLDRKTGGSFPPAP